MSWTRKIAAARTAANSGLSWDGSGGARHTGAVRGRSKLIDGQLNHFPERKYVLWGSGSRALQGQGGEETAGPCVLKYWCSTQKNPLPAGSASRLSVCARPPHPDLRLPPGCSRPASRGSRRAHARGDCPAPSGPTCREDAGGAFFSDRSQFQDSKSMAAVFLPAELPRNE